jgi:hypothetical protein
MEIRKNEEAIAPTFSLKIEQVRWKEYSQQVKSLQIKRFLKMFTSPQGVSVLRRVVCKQWLPPNRA